MATTTTNTISQNDTASETKHTAIQFSVERQCPVQYVTIYNDRAEVTRLIHHKFDNAGVYDLVIQGFSPSVDLTSLHVSGATSKACTILEVSHQIRNEALNVPVELTSLDQLRIDLDQVQIEIEKHEQEVNRLGKQRAWLDGRAAKLMNQDGQMNNNDMELMQQFIDFYYRTLAKLDEDTTREQRTINDLKKRQEGLKQEIEKRGADQRAASQTTIREVTIAVHMAAADIDLTLEIAYLISHCSWHASYDVRVTNSEGAKPKTQLTYYGSIVNRSQENWKDVQLSLSTATPSLGGSPPKLETLKIDYRYPRSRDYDRIRSDHLENQSYALAACDLAGEAMTFSKKSSRMSFRGITNLKSRSSTISEEDDMSRSNSVNVLETKAEASMSSTSFAIPRRATIEADGKPHKVTIGVLDLTSTFTYTVIPKFSTYAYLKAKTINVSDKQLLAGPASVFMDNNFLTHSSIENVCVGDTFDLSLGTDASIKVEYKPVKKLTDTQGLISKVKHETFRYETRLTNTKSTDVTVFVYQQVPLTSNEKIKVKLQQPELRGKDFASNIVVTMNDSNNLEWKCILSARNECRLPLEYTVEWPADKQVEYTES